MRPWIPAAPSARPEIPTRVETVYVLSRVTLGADIKIVSPVLRAMRTRFPEARIVFVRSLTTVSCAPAGIARPRRGSSLRMARNIVDNGLPRDHVNALKGIGVLEQDRGTDVQLMVGIALPGMPLPQDVGGSPHLPEVSVGSRVITAGSDNPSSVNQPK